MSIDTGSHPLREIFDEASEIADAGERRAFVRKACGENVALLREVEELLTAHDTAGGFFDALIPLERPPPPPDEEKIGHYRLIEKLGEGGGGVVWLAEQSEPVRRQVALKILKSGMDTHSVIARFEAERQALALMDHPGIARVFDAGKSPLGRPYFVMELVRGTHITEFCRREQLGIEPRLRLMIAVCHAVQHAHQKGIIHRDLKPSNILVTQHDGVPAPKIIDFGVAHAIEARRTEARPSPLVEPMIGSPLYMSPEQAAPGPLDIDTRSDIYSLGVLLYELLTGRTPIGVEMLHTAGLEEVRRLTR